MKNGCGALSNEPAPRAFRHLPLAIFISKTSATIVKNNFPGPASNRYSLYGERLPICLTWRRTMIASGLRATLACVDPKQLAAGFVGRAFDASLLADLPADVDPCGERGEFHTFCHAGPMFDAPISVAVGEKVERDGFWFADLVSDV